MEEDLWPGVRRSGVASGVVVEQGVQSFMYISIL